MQTTDSSCLKGLYNIREERCSINNQTIPCEQAQEELLSSKKPNKRSPLLQLVGWCRKEKRKKESIETQG